MPVEERDCQMARESCQEARRAELNALGRDLHDAVAENHRVLREIEARRDDRQERFQDGLNGVLRLLADNAIKAKIGAKVAQDDVKTLNSRLWGLAAGVLLLVAGAVIGLLWKGG